MGELFAAAKKCIGMTATLINGYASGIFYLLYSMCAYRMKLSPLYTCADAHNARKKERLSAVHLYSVYHTFPGMYTNI